MENRHSPGDMNRRDLLRLGGGVLVAGSAALRGTRAAAAPLRGMEDPLTRCLDGGPLYIEAYPTSPFVLEPFTQDLPNPMPARPSNPANWTDLGCRNWARPNCRTGGLQDCDGAVHQVGYERIPTSPRKYIAYPEPLYYRIALQVGQHSFTNSKVLPLQSNGKPVIAGMPGFGQTHLPLSTIYGFSTTPDIPNSAAFPGAMIYAHYGQPLCLRLENQLHLNAPNFDRNDFGAPTWGFLTHLHNGHTASESDGNPFHRYSGYAPGSGAGGRAGYAPTEWCDNLYLNFPAGNDPGEKQSFMWFHDHYMHHTGANVYKGMVGLFPIYDPVLDPGDEKLGLRLPGVPNPITGRTDFDIPLAFFDVAIDDGVTPHRDAHNGCGESHPEWWGQHSFRHLPNHGWVGDIFTTNCVAYPVLHVKRRKYRLRFLGASIARIYEFSFMACGKVVPAGLPPDEEQLFLDGKLDWNTAHWDSNPKKRQGQWRYRGGQQAFRLHQIAAEGGLLPFTIMRDKFEIWPAKRREFIVDFGKYLEGSPTCSEGQPEVVYLVNTYQMTNGRKRTESTRVALDALGNEIRNPDGTFLREPNPDYEPGFCVPMMKIIIDPETPEDNSVIPTQLRPLPVINTRRLKELPHRSFRLERGGRALDPETEWLINGLSFTPEDPDYQYETIKQWQPEVWTIQNGGGGWVHPMHFHYEEHRVITRNGVPVGLDPMHPDDNSREDVIALEPSEEVVMYRNFRTFSGYYVAHCHNLAHEDHNMMFGFKVEP